MEIKKKNAEGYIDPTAYEAIKKVERRGHPYRPVIYVCSPYAGDTERNTDRARRCSRFVVDKGGIPLTPHLYFPQFIKEETERDLVLFMDLVLLSKCAEVWVFGNVITDGMRREISYAQKKGKIVKLIGEEEIKCAV